MAIVNMTARNMSLSSRRTFANITKHHSSLLAPLAEWLGEQLAKL